VENVTLANLVLTGTSRSDLEPHGIPSAGDWVCWRPRPGGDAS
jgi:hypothetical protein